MIRQRLKRLEARHLAGRPAWMAAIPWALDERNEPRGMAVEGRFMTWDEIRAAYPGAPCPMGWDNSPEPPP